TAKVEAQKAIKIEPAQAEVAVAAKAEQAEVKEFKKEHHEAQRAIKIEPAQAEIAVAAKAEQAEVKETGLRTAKVEAQKAIKIEPAQAEVAEAAKAEEAEVKEFKKEHVEARKAIESAKADVAVAVKAEEAKVKELTLKKIDVQMASKNIQNEPVCARCIQEYAQSAELLGHEEISSVLTENSVAARDQLYAAVKSIKVDANALTGMVESTARPLPQQPPMMIKKSTWLANRFDAKRLRDTNAFGPSSKTRDSFSNSQRLKGLDLASMPKSARGRLCTHHAQVSLKSPAGSGIRPVIGNPRLMALSIGASLALGVGPMLAKKAYDAVMGPSVNQNGMSSRYPENK
ncbi:MAG: hypothetical protein Q8Q25_00325, partial [bacterium]|nr:hypothetical protein [bacterium]